MNYRAWRRAAAMLGLALALLGCGNSTTRQGSVPGSNEQTASACAAGARRCDDSNVKVCSADGSHETVAETCSNGQSCSFGQCLPPLGEPKTPELPADSICEAGSKRCQGGDVYLCEKDGRGLTLLAACQVGQACDSELAACVAKVCEPGQVTCDGSRVVTCNDFGSSWRSDPTDCATDGKLCVNGNCVTQLCAPNAAYCQDGNLFLCDNAGRSGTLLRVCDPQTEHCEGVIAAGVGCRRNECETGQTVCDGNTAKACAADGTVPATGTDCGVDHYCADGQCVLLTCAPGSTYCETSDVYFCDARGPPTQIAGCSAGSFCRTVDSEDAICAYAACTPEFPGCQGNQIGTCAGDARSLSVVTEDCAAKGSVCTLDLKCAKSATDTLGLAEDDASIGTNGLLGDVVDVRSARKVTELRTYMSLSSAREVRWLIYQLVGRSFVSKLEKVTAAAVMTGFVSSGPLSFQLEAGQRYLLAVVVSAGDGESSLAFTSYDRSLSFGGVAGRVAGSYAELVDTSSFRDDDGVYRMQVVTEAP